MATTSQLVKNYISTNPTFKKVCQLVTSDKKLPSIDHVAVRFLHRRQHLNIFTDRKLIIQPHIYNFPSFQATARWFTFENNPLLKRLFVTTYQGNVFPPILNHKEYNHVAKSNPFLAWTTLFDGHLNHIALEVPDIEIATEKCIQNGIQMNTSNGLYKVSRDGLLIQTATMAVPTPYRFVDGCVATVPYTFVELVERRKDSEGKLREGFEEENAFHIFQSTTATK